MADYPDLSIFYGIRCSGNLKFWASCLKAASDHLRECALGGLSICFDNCSGGIACISTGTLTLLRVFTNGALVKRIGKQSDYIFLILDDVIKCPAIWRLVMLRSVFAGRQLSNLLGSLVAQALLQNVFAHNFEAFSSGHLDHASDTALPFRHLSTVSRIGWIYELFQKLSHSFLHSTETPIPQR
ncbi:MAG: hypothetical protein CGW95_09450 [Phenylobacterium zucineum]|nr:MAG: hypothetical protein CGW95_09450 [Phenylobacterium zucineum]